MVLALVGSACSSDGDSLEALGSDADAAGAIDEFGEERASDSGLEPEGSAPTTAAPTTAVPATTVPPSYCETAPFVIDETTAVIVDPNGQPFLPRGINLTAGAYDDGAYWEATSATDLTADGVAKMRDVWAFNTVRLNLHHGANPDIFDDPELLRVIGLFTAADMVVIVEMHSFGTGLDPTPEQIQITADGFAALANRYEGNHCVWFNPFNEPGGKVDISEYHINAADVSASDAWIQWHVPVIDAIRAVSDAVVVVDETHWGQGRAGNDYNPLHSATLVHGEAMNARYDNILFSVHFYDRWGGRSEDLVAFFAEAKAKGLAVIAGETGGHPEVGNKRTRDSWPTVQALFALNQPGIGILLWHANQGHQSGMSVGRSFGQRTPVWEILDRADTEAAGTLLWDWTHNPPSATP